MQVYVSRVSMSQIEWEMDAMSSRESGSSGGRQRRLDSMAGAQLVTVRETMNKLLGGIWCMRQYITNLQRCLTLMSFF